MNMVLLFDQDFYADNKVSIVGRRAEHIYNIHAAKPGTQLQVGLLNGKKGTGEIISIDASSVKIEVALNTLPPSPPPLTIILALPRPKMLRRIIFTLTTLGVKKIILINSYRVEKSYWQSPSLDLKNLNNFIHLGLEQAKDTISPTIEQHYRFKPFVEDTLPGLTRSTLNLIAHPNAKETCPNNLTKSVTLAVGPEGGFIDYEIGKFEESGFAPIHLGPRILTVETAIPVLVSKLFQF